MIPFSFLFVELVALLLFFLAAFEARRKGLSRLTEFLMIFFYGIILEELDMRIFKSYHYGPHFSFTLWQVPVCIALLWAVIIAGSMAISDAWGLPEFVKPFSDALLAVWIDLAVDAIAIRIGYWTWVIPLDEGWFGVPAGNLYAWMWVAFSYSVFARVVRRKTERNKVWVLAYWVLPLFSYVAFFLGMNFVGNLGKLLGLKTQAERLSLFATQFFIFAAIVFLNWSPSPFRHTEGGSALWRISSPPKWGRGEGEGEKRVSPPLAPIWKWSRLVIHLYFLFAYFFLGMFREVPLLGVVASLILAGEIILWTPKNILTI